MKPSRAVIDAVNVQAAARLKEITDNRQKNVTASTKVTAVANEKLTRNLNNRFELNARLSPKQSGDGTIIGKVRSNVFDQSIINSIIKIEKQAAVLVAKQNTTTDISADFISPDQRYTATQNADIVSQSQKTELVRTYQKIQSKCNHIYDRSSNRCTLCKKHIDSHVYDVGAKLLLKVTP